MQKSEINILIVEDDPSLGHAIEEGLKRAGYSTKFAADPSVAKSALKLHVFHGLVVDCMLPQKNGVDLAVETLAHHPNLVTVLTSGIYKDRAYANDAQVRTRARAFLKKPFDIQSLIDIFDLAFKDTLEDAHEPLHQLFIKEQYSPRDKLAAIENTKYVHGFDLPIVFSMLLDSQISGYLEVTYDDGRLSQIGFNRGRIDYVKYADVESYFGVLLVEKGFTSPEEVDEILAQTSDGKPLGEKLIESSYLSPHAIEIVQHEQMLIRISKMIQDTSVKINFVTETRPNPDVFIDGFLFAQLLSDWISSKLTPEWLKSFFVPWADNPLLAGANSAQLDLIKDLPAPRPLIRATGFQNWPRTLSDLLNTHRKIEAEVERGIYFMLALRILRFGPKSGLTETNENKIFRLSRIWNEMQKQNYFETLGLSRQAKPSEIHRAYHELAKSFHPDRLNPDASNEIRTVQQQIFTQITNAYQTLHNPDKHTLYVRTLDVGLAEDILKAESTFEEGQRLLQQRAFRDARKTFERASKMKGRRSDTIIYYIWALIKDKRHKADRRSLAEKIATLMPQVAHEDRHGATYYFIRGMYYELTGQVQKAYMNFKHAMSLDPFFEDAKREMTYIKTNYSRSNKTIFSDDLSQVVTKFFKKRSG
jgi:CheY-like chemotaxis protein